MMLRSGRFPTEKRRNDMHSTSPTTASGKPFSSDAFEAWLHARGTCANHLNTREFRVAMKEFLAAH